MGGQMPPLATPLFSVPYAYGCTVRVYAYGMYHTRMVQNTHNILWYRTDIVPAPVINVNGYFTGTSP